MVLKLLRRDHSALRKFENDVKMYGTQTQNAGMSFSIGLRMM